MPFTSVYQRDGSTSTPEGLKDAGLCDICFNPFRSYVTYNYFSTSSKWSRRLTDYSFAIIIIIPRIIECRAETSSWTIRSRLGVCATDRL